MKSHPAVAERPDANDRRYESTEHGARSVAQTIIDSQPRDAGLDEILRALGFHRVVQRGLADADAGRVMNHEMFRRKMDSWLG